MIHELTRDDVDDILYGATLFGAVTCELGGSNTAVPFSSLR